MNLCLCPVGCPTGRPSLRVAAPLRVEGRVNKLEPCCADVRGVEEFCVAPDKGTGEENNGEENNGKNNNLEDRELDRGLLSF